MKRLLQSLDAPAEQQSRALDLTHRPRHGWRTIKELREELRFSTDDACRSWLRREGIACVRRGRVILVSSIDIERALRSA